MRFGIIGIIRSQVRDWWVRQRYGSFVVQRSIDEILIRYKESVRAEAKAGRESNRKDENYHAGATDMLKWLIEGK